MAIGEICFDVEYIPLPDARIRAYWASIEVLCKLLEDQNERCLAVDTDCERSHDSVARASLGEDL
jgi:hypothetical protein